MNIIVADRFYNDFSLLNIWDSKGFIWLLGTKKTSNTLL